MLLPKSADQVVKWTEQLLFGITEVTCKVQNMILFKQYNIPAINEFVAREMRSKIYPM